MSKDGYNLFFDYFDIDKNKFIQFGIDSFISAPQETAAVAWEDLKSKFKNNEELYIRGYGRKGNSEALLREIFDSLFGYTNFKVDVSNNRIPYKKIREWTKFEKVGSNKKLTRGYTQIKNFQVSHVFGCTKNPLMFTAPWNIVYLPKIMDPFTGHEAKHELVGNFSDQLCTKIYDAYGSTIDECVELIGPDIEARLRDAIQKLPQALKKEFGEEQILSDLKGEFSPTLPNTKVPKAS